MNTKKNWVTSFLSPFIGSADEIDTATSAGTQLQAKKDLRSRIADRRSGVRWQKRYPMKMRILGSDLIHFHFYILIFPFE